MGSFLSKINMLLEILRTIPIFKIPEKFLPPNLHTSLNKIRQIRNGECLSRNQRITASIIHTNILTKGDHVNIIKH